MSYLFKALLFGFCFCGCTFFVGCNPCGCPSDTPPFFDYHELMITTNRENLPYNIDFGRSLELEIGIDSIHFLVQQNNCQASAFSAQLTAFTCEKLGEKGSKYDVTAIDIFATPPFRSDVSDSSYLNAFFHIKTNNNPNVRNPLAISDLELYPLSLFPYGYYYKDFFTLQTDSIPDVAGTYQFTVAIEKSNGEVLTAQTEPITWEE